MRTGVTIPGVNIQSPWSMLLLCGSKTIETRNYPLPNKHIGKPLAIIETPGKSRPRFSARITGIVIFESCFEYTSQAQWRNDRDRHLVDPTDSFFKFVPGKRKFAWVVSWVEPLVQPVAPPKSRGIVFATCCQLSADSLTNRAILKVL
jgi:hypothetical protein